MGLEARLLLGHCSPRLSALSGPSRIGPTDHFEGIRASHIKGQTLVEMAGTHHRSHIMENVTLTPKEQSRLQVLNSLAAEHMTLDQATELMGVTSRTPAASWRPTVNAARRLWHMATAVADPSTPRPRRWSSTWRSWLGPGTLASTTPISRNCWRSGKACTSAGPPCGGSCWTLD